MPKACWSLAEFCWICCLLPKNKLKLRTGRSDRPERLRNGALSSGVSCHVMPPPSSGANADELMERARERRLVTKSRLNRYINQRHTRAAHQLFGVVNAVLDQPLVSGCAKRRFE
jgi:hypothetical protein